MKTCFAFLFLALFWMPADSFAQTKTTSADNRYKELVDKGASLISYTNSRNVIMTSEAENRAFQTSYEKFKSKVSDQKVSDTEKAKALQEYHTALERYKVATQRDSYWYQKKSNTGVVDSNLKIANQMKDINDVSTTSAAAKTIVPSAPVTANVTSRVDLVPNSDIKLNTNDARACGVFGCVKNADGSFSPQQKLVDRPVESTAPAQFSKVADTGVRLPTSDGRACGVFGCAKNEDGTYSPIKNMKVETSSNPAKTEMAETKVSQKSESELTEEKAASLKRRQEYSDSVNPRCFYSGFPAGKDDKCVAISSSEAAAKMGFDIKGMKKTDCGADRVLCNPLYFGLAADKKGICVARNSDASETCGKMKLADSKNSMKELLENPENRKLFEKINHSVEVSCDDSRLKEDKALSKNIKLRSSEKSVKDHQKTCKTLLTAMDQAKAKVKSRQNAIQSSGTGAGTTAGGIDGQNY